jgi:diguanylate cyclase (GGDEF)-like protein
MSHTPGQHNQSDTASLFEDPRHNLELMRRIAALMLIVGGLTSGIGPWTTMVTPIAKGFAFTAGLVFVCTGGLLAVLRPRLNVVTFVVFASILVLGVLIAGSNPLGMSPFFMLWPVVFAAYFFPQRTLVAVYCWMIVCLTGGLIANHHHELKLDTFFGTVSGVGTMAVLVAMMNRREGSLRAQLEISAATDPLTGLLNRRAFDPELDAMIGRAVAAHEPLALVMFDLDHFKAFNDQHGHLVGDEALRRLAAVLRQQSRRLDAVSRFGGEEFAVALPGANVAEATAYAERVAAALTRSGEPDWTLSISAGIGLLQHHGDDAAVLLARADQALYAAKHAGRARAGWFDGEVRVGPRFADH